jgi:hypothetical protein
MAPEAGKSVSTDPAVSPIVNAQHSRTAILAACRQTESSGSLVTLGTDDQSRIFLSAVLAARGFSLIRFPVLSNLAESSKVLKMAQK